MGRCVNEAIIFQVCFTSEAKHVTHLSCHRVYPQLPKAPESKNTKKRLEVRGRGGHIKFRERGRETFQFGRNGAVLYIKRTINGCYGCRATSMKMLARVKKKSKHKRYPCDQRHKGETKTKLL